MKVRTNKISDNVRYYVEKLQPIYTENEARQLVWMLVENYFKHNRSALALNPELRISESEMLKLHYAVKDLLKQKPVQYILGSANFNGHQFEVNSDVLIPRPETEQLVSIATDFMQMNNRKNVLDIGTGSGCIAISIALQLPDLHIDAVDVSENALVVASRNAQTLGANIDFHCADITSDKFKSGQINYDLIVSNPPYVTHSEKNLMRANVINWEPAVALFVSDNDPLVFYRAIISVSINQLNMGGMLLVEINEKFGKEVAQLFAANGFANIHLINDIHEKPRFVSGVYPK